MGKLSLFLIIYGFVALIGFSDHALAQAMCVDIFHSDEVEIKIQPISEIANYETASDFQKFDQKIRNLEKRIRFYSELTGSETNRTLVEAESYAGKIKDQVRLGLTTKVVEKIGSLFKRYEVDIRLAEKLKIEISSLRELQQRERIQSKKSQIEQIIKGKQAERNILDKHIGQNYYRYITLKEALNQMASSKVEVAAERAKEVISALEILAANHALTYGLVFKALSAAEVKSYVQSNIKTQHALLKKAAIDEFFLMLRLMTFSGPIVNSIKSVLYKIPEKIIMGPFMVPARKVITEAFSVGYNQHLRSTYLEDIEMVIEAKSPLEKFELLRSLNVKSEKPDELLELFSRVVENTEEWEAIKSVAASKASENERFKQFYGRILEADKRALSKEAFPLYYQEPGANAFGKIVLGTYVAIYAGETYIKAHPELTHSFMDGLTQFTTVIQSLF